MARKEKRTGLIGNAGPSVIEKRERELKAVKGKIADPSKYISRNQLSEIRDTLIQTHAGLVIRGMMDKEARAQLEDVIRREYKTQTGGREELVEYIARETVGTGVIEDIMENDKSVTDIGYNGSHLIVESSDRKTIYTDDVGIDDNYIVRLVNKFAHANGRDFTEKNPVFDGTYDNVRINAMFSSNTVDGVTMSLRVVRPMLALTKETFETFAPMYIYDLLEAFVLAKGNFVIAGETGTGKTELQKLLASFIPFSERVVLIEDVAETFLKEMFPDKDIFSWLTSQDITITHLVKAALRNNPRWILVSETRGQEAYEMIQAVLSGHSIITTLHAVNARAIPKRLINMAKMGYEFSEEGLESDIRRYFDFGVHIVRSEYKGKTLRYCNEIVYYDNEGDHTIFKQDFTQGRFICQTSELPDEWKRRLLRQNLEVEGFKEYQAHDRFANVERVEHEDGTVKLDLEMKMGEEVGIEDLYKYVNNDDIIAIPGDKAKILREQKERERAQQESIDVGDKVEETLFQGEDDYEMVDTAVQQDAKRRLNEIREQQEAKKNLVKTAPELKVPKEDIQDETDEDRDSLFSTEVQSEAERILARHRERVKKSQYQTRA